MKGGHFYRYKGKLPVGFLGLVDDIVGITEAGYPAQQLNTFLNLKTAEKGLQFGVDKCKSMLISKENENGLNCDLMVDSWESYYEEDPTTGKLSLIERFVGQTKIEQTEEQLYLGFVISSSGNNMANINHIKKKSIGVIKKIFNRLNSLNLQTYFFECAMIFLNAVLRPSILYACEGYYNLKETEIRQIERIEENYLRKVLKTQKGCPIVQLYLEMGHQPARLDIQKTRLLFLQYILQQSEKSSIHQFLKLQLEQPARGDWGSTCLQDLRELGIEEGLEEIKNISKIQFTKILKGKLKTKALSYLLEKQGSKGKDLRYSCLEMSEYLLPSNNQLSLEEKRRMFEIRNKMSNIPANFQSSKNITKCLCDEPENMEHLYDCEFFDNRTEQKLPYQKLYNGNIFEQIEVFRKMQKTLEIRENLIHLNESLPRGPKESTAFSFTVVMDEIFVIYMASYFIA